jgi:hypothetical protein
MDKAIIMTKLFSMNLQSAIYSGIIVTILFIIVKLFDTWRKRDQRQAVRFEEDPTVSMYD